MEQVEQNVLGTALRPCCSDPMTGFFRDGFCHHSLQDPGQHTVCAEMTAEFLAFSAEHGNDLSTPRPEFHFPGLQPGDKWCVCLGRWIQALEAGLAPPIDLNATHASVLKVVDLEILKQHAITSGMELN